MVDTIVELLVPTTTSIHYRCHAPLIDKCCQFPANTKLHLATTRAIPLHHRSTPTRPRIETTTLTPPLHHLVNPRRGTVDPLPHYRPYDVVLKWDQGRSFDFWCLARQKVVETQCRSPRNQDVVAGLLAYVRDLTGDGDAPYS